MYRRLATFTILNLSTLITAMREEAPLSAVPLPELTRVVRTQLAKVSYQLQVVDVQYSIGS